MQGGGISAQPRFVGWRVADWRRVGTRMLRTPGQGFHGKDPYREGACESCGQPTWFDSDLIGGRVLTCWPCAGGVQVVARGGRRVA